MDQKTNSKGLAVSNFGRATYVTPDDYSMDNVPNAAVVANKFLRVHILLG